MSNLIDFEKHRAKVRRESADQRSRRLTKAFANRRQSPPSLKETMERVDRNMRGFVGGRGPDDAA